MLKLYIQRFAEGGEAGAEGGAKAAAFDVDAEIAKRFPYEAGLAAPHKKQAEAQTKAPEPDAGTGQAESAGQDAAAAEPEDKPEQTEDEDALLQQFMKAHPEAVRKWSQGMINDRFKNHNAELARLQAELDAWKDAYDPYARTLDVDITNPEAVREAVMNDQRNFRKAALDKGIPVEQAILEYQQERQTEREQAETKRRQDEIAERQRRAQAEQLREAWNKEADEIRKTDPEFDLERELKSTPEFLEAVNAGMSVTFAYRATHYDANMARIAGAVERQTAANTAAQIASGRNRPAEGGLGTTPAVSTKTSYKNMSDKEFLDLFHKMGF